MLLNPSVPPSLPGLVLKAWVLFEGTTILRASNVSAVASGGAGLYNITFTGTPFSGTNYLAFGYADGWNGGSLNGLAVGNNSTRTAGSCQISTRNSTGVLTACNGGIYCGWYE